MLDEQGFFASVTIDRNRLYSQVLDNLNKAASVGFPYTEIGERLSGAWYGDPGQRRVYADAQECANRFRQYCLEHNLLDFSLQLDIFWNILWRTPQCHDYLTRQYRHLICDNIEEDIPVAHDLLAEWLPDFDSALIIYDEDGGYRRFLGADPDSALRLADLCESHAVLTESFVTTPESRRWKLPLHPNFCPTIRHPLHRKVSPRWSFRLPGRRPVFTRRCWIGWPERSSTSSKKKASRLPRSLSWLPISPMRCASRSATAWKNWVSPGVRTGPPVRCATNPPATAC